MNRRRLWTHRILLESIKHSENSFVGLTYSPEAVPRLSSGVETLRPLDLQLWLKRIRKAYPGPLRFFGVGEYGDSSWRPHYHVALFGYKGCARGDSRFGRQPCPCASCELLRRTWSNGVVHQGVIERKSAQYIAGYTVKRLTNADDERLGGRLPEFARMSLRPGIGAFAMQDVGNTLRGIAYDRSRDVPSSLRHGVREMPLGRYLIRRLRVELGRSPDTPESKLAEIAAELQPLREIASSLSDPEVYAPGQYNQEIFARLLVESDAQKVKSWEARRKLFERGKK